MLEAANIVDDNVFPGEKFAVDQFINDFDNTFKYRTVTHGPRNILF